VLKDYFEYHCYSVMYREAIFSSGFLSLDVLSLLNSTV